MNIGCGCANRIALLPVLSTADRRREPKVSTGDQNVGRCPVASHMAAEQHLSEDEPLHVDSTENPDGVWSYSFVYGPGCTARRYISHPTDRETVSTAVTVSESEDQSACQRPHVEAQRQATT